MHLAIDIREACRTKRAGKGQWTYGFTRELLRRAIPLTLFSDTDIPAEWHALVEKRPDVRVRIIPKKGMGWHVSVAREVMEDARIDMYVSTVSYIVPFVVRRRKKIIPIVHDLIAFMNEPHDRRATFIERLTLGTALKHAHRICTVSETTKSDLLHRFPSIDPARVIPVFAAPHGEASVVHRNEDVILCVSTLCPRKNQKKLIQAYAQLSDAQKKRHPLVLVGGRGWQDDDIIRLAANTPGVEWKGYLADKDIEKLYAHCAVFAYPSLYEGFGLPILEAMRRGIPVLTSNIGSMKEIAGESALLVQPQSIDQIRTGLQKLLSDDILRSRLSHVGMRTADGFSWDRTVDLFLHALAD